MKTQAASIFLFVLAGSHAIAGDQGYAFDYDGDGESSQTYYQDSDGDGVIDSFQTFGD